MTKGLVLEYETVLAYSMSVQFIYVFRDEILT